MPLTTTSGVSKLRYARSRLLKAEGRLEATIVELATGWAHSPTPLRVEAILEALEQDLGRLRATAALLDAAIDEETA